MRPETVKEIREQHGIRVEFSPKEYEATVRHAREVDRRLRALGRKKDHVKKPGIDQIMEKEVPGLLAEWAFHRAFCLPYTLRFQLSGDGGVDARLANGGTVNQRFGSKRGYNFGLYQETALKTDYAVLVWPFSRLGISPVFDVWGWLPREKFNALVEDINFGHNIHKGVRYEHFRPIDTLLAIHQLSL